MVFLGFEKKTKMLSKWLLPCKVNGKQIHIFYMKIIVAAQHNFYEKIFCNVSNIMSAKY